MARSALFLDRDGVINIDKNYVYKIEDFEFVEGIFELCRFYSERGFLIFIVTNQAGIARKYYTVKDFVHLTKWMEKKFLDNGVLITKTYFCPHHPDFNISCDCRKPMPGMIYKARNEFNIDLSQSILIGDKPSDIEAAKSAGIYERYLISTNGAPQCTRNNESIIVSKHNEIIRMAMNLKKA